MKECIDSALNQTYSDLEVIVCDDCSIDNSLEILNQYGKKIKVISNKIHSPIANHNQYNAIRNAFKVSSGDVIFLLDSDDVFKLDKVEKIMPYFKEMKVVMLQHKLSEIDRYSIETGRVRPLLNFTENHLQYIEDTGSILSLFAPTSSQVYSRAFLSINLEKIVEYSHQNVWTDLRLPYHAIFNGRIISLEDPLAYYRIHHSNDSSKLAQAKNYMTFLEECRDYFINVSKSYTKGFTLLEFPEMFRYSPILTNFCNFETLKQIAPSDSIFIWGAGEAGRAINQYLITKGIKVSGFIEGNELKHGEIIDNLEVFSEEILFEKTVSQLIISPFYEAGNIQGDLEKKFTSKIEIINPYV